MKRLENVRNSEAELMVPQSQYGDMNEPSVRLSFKASNISNYDLGNESDEEWSVIGWKRSYLNSKRVSHIADPQKNIKVNPSYRRAVSKFSK